MGQRNGFSSGDVTKLNAMYHCNKASAGSVPNRPVSSSSSTAQRPNSPARPNRPILNILGNIVRPFRPRGDEDDEEYNDDMKNSKEIQTNEI